MLSSKKVQPLVLITSIMEDTRVYTWLKSVGLDGYYPSFVEKKVTAEQFIGFTMQDYGMSVMLICCIVLLYCSDY